MKVCDICRKELIDKEDSKGLNVTYEISIVEWHKDDNGGPGKQLYFGDEICKGCAKMVALFVTEVSTNRKIKPFVIKK